MDQNGPARAPTTGRLSRPAKKGRNPQIIRTTPGKRWSAQAERLFLEELAATANVRGAAAATGFSTTALYNRRMRWPAFAEAWQQALEQGYARIETALIEMASDTAIVWSDAKAAAEAAEAGAAEPKARAEAQAGMAGAASGGPAPYRPMGGASAAGQAVPYGAGPRGRALDVVDGGVVSRRPALSVSEMMNILKLHRASVRGGAAQDYGWRAGPPDMAEIRASIWRKIEAIERAAERRRAAEAEAEAGAEGAREG